MALSQHTQPLTQEQFDQRREGLNNSGLRDEDISDVICILHPTTVAAVNIVKDTGVSNPQHILQNSPFNQYEHMSDLTEAETIRLEEYDVSQAQDIALRFSSRLRDITTGFLFGRVRQKCDICLDPRGDQGRVSQTHFRIYVNKQGIIMLEDNSMNGTIVDSVALRGRKEGWPTAQILQSGSVIEIMAPSQEDLIKFIVRIPARDGHVEQYTAKFHQFMAQLSAAERKLQAFPGPQNADGPGHAAPLKETKVLMPPPHVSSSRFGMKWDGGGKYRDIGLLGTGAFATVYLLTKLADGTLYAGKELEKRRVMKNGFIDQRIENEMEIMKALRHPNIVQYHDYNESKQHLYIIMEYVPGGDLQNYLKIHPTLAEDLAKPMTRQVLEALQYLHQMNITHRDIKPDNILIVSEKPFSVKLTDFGLSKVVKSNETFLKTFCGTLLYCAPEVFPHYDGYMNGQRQKRRHSEQAKQRSYSQLVDVWSYAAVLWYSLCGQPPFEGVTDQTGRGMFEKIMNTQLDVRPLQIRNISPDAIHLLLRMLDTDPSSRITEQGALAHPWIANVPSSRFENDSAGRHNDVVLGASKLSIQDEGQRSRQYDPNNVSSQESSDSQELHESKRMRSEVFPSANNDSVHSSASGILFENIPIVNGAVHSQQDIPQGQRPNRLFGEISNRALTSSNVLGQTYGDQTHVDEPAAATAESKLWALPELDGADDNSMSENNQSDASRLEPTDQTDPSTGQTDPKSLYGTEAMVRDLRMSSPSRSGPAGDLAPQQMQVPQTPPAHSQAGIGEANVNSESSEITPRALPQQAFSRQINLPLPASFFYDPYDTSTHSLEYASKISGKNFTEERSDAKENIPVAGSTNNESVAAEKEHDGTEKRAPLEQRSIQAGTGKQEVADPTWQPQNGAVSTTTTIPSSFPESTSTAASTRRTDKTGVFLKPALPASYQQQHTSSPSANTPSGTPEGRTFGRLATTADSFINLSVSMQSYTTTFGRSQQNTLVYPDRNDVRVPKIAFELIIFSPGPRSGQSSQSSVATDVDDPEKLKSADVVIRTRSKAGVWVNGIHLYPEDAEGRVLFGRLRTGDELVVTKTNAGRLAFACTFDVGLACQPRALGEPFVVETEKPRNGHGNGNGSAKTSTDK